MADNNIIGLRLTMSSLEFYEYFDPLHFLGYQLQIVINEDEVDEDDVEVVEIIIQDSYIFGFPESVFSDFDDILIINDFTDLEDLAKIIFFEVAHQMLSSEPPYRMTTDGVEVFRDRLGIRRKEIVTKEATLEQIIDYYIKPVDITALVFFDSTDETFCTVAWDFEEQTSCITQLPIKSKHLIPYRLYHLSLQCDYLEILHAIGISEGVIDRVSYSFITLRRDDKLQWEMVLGGSQNSVQNRLKPLYM